MPGSGKSAFDTIAEEMGFSVIIMGDAIRSEAVKRDLEPTPENIGKIMIRIRLDEGPEVVAKRCIPKIREAKTRGVVVDGIRSLMEVEEFRKSFPKFKVLYIHSPPEVRYQRVSNRRRSDDPQSWQIFVERDYRELGVGIGSAAAMADYVIVNNGTLPQLKKNVRKFLKEVQNE
ncbi:MAG: hypothetical protein QG670_176 [Thermoproteota archaeon]|nr:hypothetical protein [Thermoproteota archaeon]